jgi:CheY-like chemotaxis protein
MLDGKTVVLVVDDEDDIREFALMALEDSGFHGVAAPNAEAALQVLGTTPVDVLVTDVVMPGRMSGVDLARQARRINPKIRVICASGFNSALDIGTAVLRKPYDARSLKREIDLALATRPGPPALSSQL